jgi:hypothetical protein
MPFGGWRTREETEQDGKKGMARGGRGGERRGGEWLTLMHAIHTTTQTTMYNRSLLKPETGRVVVVVVYIAKRNMRLSLEFINMCLISKTRIKWSFTTCQFRP